MEKVHIDRINELAREAKRRALTSEERAERERLRAAYLKAFREQTRAQLENTYVQYPDGSKVKLKDAKKP